MAENKENQEAEKAETPVEGMVNAEEKPAEVSESTGTTGKAEETGKEPEKKEDKDNKKTSESRKPKKTEAVVNSYNAHLSPKTSAAVCRFIVGKTIDKATADLREVSAGRRPVPMKGEIPHRKGKIMSGRFPRNAANHFVTLLKTLAGNSSVNGLEEPIIAEAIANVGNRPYGQFGRVRKKRAHIKIIAKNKPDWKKLRSKKNKKALKDKKHARTNSKNKTAKKDSKDKKE